MKNFLQRGRLRQLRSSASEHFTVAAGPAGVGGRPATSKDGLEVLGVHFCTTIALNPVVDVPQREPPGLSLSWGCRKVEPHVVLPLLGLSKRTVMAPTTLLPMKTESRWQLHSTFILFLPKGSYRKTRFFWRVALPPTNMATDREIIPSKGKEHLTDIVPC